MTAANDATDGPTPAETEAHEALQFYTLAHGDPAFVHQYVVDAWAAQHATARSKPIGVTFALVGLYLHLERGFTGRQVQRVHMALAQRGREWPTFALPASRGELTAAHVMRAPEGVERDRAIDAWCTSVWAAYRASRTAIVELLARHRIHDTPDAWATGGNRP